MADENLDPIKEVIRQELERSAVAKTLEVYNDDSRRGWGAFFAHPFVLTVAGFLLTAGIGTWIEYRISENQQIRDQIAHEVEDAQSDAAAAQKEAVEIASHLLERTARSALLRSALSRNASDEIRPRKAAYDEAYFTWNAAQQSNLVELRNHVFDAANAPLTKPSIYEEFILVDVVNALAAGDSCLTQAYDHWRRQTGAGGQETLGQFSCTPGAADTELWSAAVRRYETLANDCMGAILADALRYFQERETARIELAREAGTGIGFPVPDPDGIARVCRPG